MAKSYIAISNKNEQDVDNNTWFERQILTSVITRCLQDRVYILGHNTILSEDAEQSAKCMTLFVAQANTSSFGHYIFVIRPGNERQTFIFRKISFETDEACGNYTVGELVDTIMAPDGTIKSITDNIIAWAKSKKIF